MPGRLRVAGTTSKFYGNTSCQYAATSWNALDSCNPLQFNTISLSLRHNMPPERYPPKQAARQAGVAANTARFWAKEYREFFSAAANPPPGEERSFSLEDVATLQAIAQMRVNGLTPNDIRERLRTMPPGTLQDVTSHAGTPTTGVTVHTGTDIPHDSIQAFLARTEVLDELKNVDRRLERLESSRNLVLVAVAAFVAGVVLVGVIVLLLR